MSKRPITALMAALALLAVAPAASFAQSPTPTATAAQDDGTAADPPADASKEVKAVYTDYSRDGVIDVCDHTRDGAAGDARRDRGRLRPRLPGLPRGGQGRHPAPRQGPLRRRGGDRHRDRDGHRHRLAGRHRDGRRPTTARSRRPPTTGRHPARRRRAPARHRRRLDAARGRRAAAGADGSARRRCRRRRSRRTVAPATPTPVPTPVVVSRSSTDGLLVPGILVGIALLGALVLTLAAAHRPLAADAPRVQRGRLPRQGHVGGLLGLAQVRPLSVTPLVSATSWPSVC